MNALNECIGVHTMSDYTVSKGLTSYSSLQNKAKTGTCSYLILYHFGVISSAMQCSAKDLILFIARWRLFRVLV